jgi:ATP-binding cassette, subfamily B, multidrug efflux pump
MVEEEVVGKVYDSRLMRRLLVYMWPYKWAVVVSLAFLLVNSVLQVVGPLLMKMAIDRYLAPADQRSSTPIDAWLAADPWTGLAQVSIVYLAAIIGILVMEFGQTYLMQRTGQKAMFDLRRDLMAHLQRLDIRFYDRNPVGRLVTRVTTEMRMF